jgi:hypothetical protein
MIIAPSHITLLAFSDKDKGPFFNEFGYKLIFYEIGVPNPVQKNKFLHRQYRSHSISYFRPEVGLPIEIIRYDKHRIGNGSFLKPVFSLSQKEFFGNYRRESRLQDVWSDVYQFNPLFYCSSQYKTPIYISANNNFRGGVECIIIPTRKITRAMEFWKNGLHFKVCSEGITPKRRSWALLKFEALRGFQSLSIILAESQRTRTLPMLDDDGFSCLSFISTDLDHDVQELSKFGIKDACENFQLVINKKKLKICIVRGSNEELVEFIEIVRL